MRVSSEAEWYDRFIKMRYLGDNKVNCLDSVSFVYDWSSPSHRVFLTLVVVGTQIASARRAVSSLVRTLLNILYVCVVRIDNELMPCHIIMN